jgi:Ca2+-binding EF-hand superfamily protein
MKHHGELFNLYLRKLNAANLEQVRQKFRAESYTIGRQDFEKLFRHYTRHNESMKLDFEGFRKAVRKDAKITERGVGDGVLQDMFDAVDTDRSGQIDLAEFEALLKSTDTAAILDSMQALGQARTDEATLVFHDQQIRSSHQGDAPAQYRYQVRRKYKRQAYVLPGRDQDWRALFARHSEASDAVPGPAGLPGSVSFETFRRAVRDTQTPDSRPA